MAEEIPQYHPQFENEVKGVVVGERNIVINNYNSYEVKPVESADTENAELPCPYRGLFHFGPNDAEFFFGRNLVIEELYSATKTRDFIPVLGASGSGKSSVVLAGLVPKLQKEGHWQFTHFRPGSDPFHALSLALVPLYAANLNETDRIAQARQLANYLQNGEIPFADVFIQIQHHYPQERILLIADQFEELYTLCSDIEIRRKFLDTLISKFPAYEDIGEVEGALARHADEKYGNLSEEEKEKVRRIFIQLVRPGEGTEDTRRTALKGELGQESWSLVQKLADVRLVVTSRNANQQETVEVVHEALIRNWGELRDWMETDRVFRGW